MFWKVQEILYLIGTDISLIGQREAVKIEIEDFDIKSKSGFFYQLFVCIEPLFLIHFLTKILSFCNHWKGNFLNYSKLANIGL